MALSRRELAQVWVNAGGDPAKAGLMAEIARRESGGRPKANNAGLNSNGTVDHGLWQINDIWRKDPVVGPLFRSGAIYTPEGNAKAAVRIMRQQGPRAWATYNAGIDAKYLGGFKHLKAQEPLARSMAARDRGNSTGGIADALAGLQTDNRQAAQQKFVGDLFARRRGPDSTLAKLLGGQSAEGPSNTALALAMSLAQQKAPRIDSGGKPSTGAAAAPRGKGGAGKFIITGPNPKRLQPKLVDFARRVAGVYGHPLTGSDGATHSKYTVDGNISDHWSGNATDIPATGKTLIAMGRAALIAAGMPRAQAMKQNGGLYNVGGHQVIFNTHLGGDHTNHLHISAR